MRALKPVGHSSVASAKAGGWACRPPERKPSLVPSSAPGLPRQAGGCSRTHAAPFLPETYGIWEKSPSAGPPLALVGLWSLPKN